MFVYIMTYLRVGASYRHSVRDFFSAKMKSVGIAEVWVVVSKTILVPPIDTYNKFLKLV